MRAMRLGWFLHFNRRRCSASHLVLRVLSASALCWALDAGIGAGLQTASGLNVRSSPCLHAAAVCTLHMGARWIWAREEGYRLQLVSCLFGKLSMEMLARAALRMRRHPPGSAGLKPGIWALLDAWADCALRLGVCFQRSGHYRGAQFTLDAYNSAGWTLASMWCGIKAC
jgi:hypothetical protein